MKLKIKLILGFMFAVPLLTVVGGINNHTIKVMGRNIDGITKDTAPLIATLGALHAATLEMVLAAYGQAAAHSISNLPAEDGWATIEAQELEHAKKEAAEALELYRAATLDATDESFAKQLSTAETDLYEASKHLVSLVAHHVAGEDVITARDAVEHTEAVAIETIEKALEVEKNELKEKDQQATATVQHAFLLNVGSVMLVSLFACLLGALLARHIVHPILALQTAAGHIGQGNFETVIPVTTSDEVGVLATSLRGMQEQLQGQRAALQQKTHNLERQVQEVAQGVTALTDATTTISAAITRAVTASTQTAAAVVETSTTIDEVRQTANVATAKSRDISEASQQTAHVSQNGEAAVEAALGGIHHIQEQMGSIAQSVVKLSEQSQAIGSILETMTGIADQSNLLAVNAAIEATRAGNEGRGFGVVAQEVKLLATQSKQATMQVRTILTDIQRAAVAAIDVTSQGAKSAEVGAKQALEAQETIQVLAQNINESVRFVTQIAASSSQQLVGVDQVALAMSSIKSATADNLQGLKEIEGAVRNLQRVGTHLQTLVDGNRTIAETESTQANPLLS